MSHCLPLEKESQYHEQNGKPHHYGRGCEMSQIEAFPAGKTAGVMSIDVKKFHNDPFKVYFCFRRAGSGWMFINFNT
jgi:hypothetical protein